MTFNQAEFDIRCEWGREGVDHLAANSDVVIIVDVMSFSSGVDIAVSRGANIYPYHDDDASAREFASSIGAELAGRRGAGEYSLSPVSMLAIPPKTRLVLPSPNGAALTLACGSTTTFTGCLRNSHAVAQAAMVRGRRIAVIPAGERWKDSRTLRPALEDLIGAGAIISHLKGRRSPEAEGAAAVYERLRGELKTRLTRCSSGRELTQMGFADDIDLIADIDCSTCAPLFTDGAYVQIGSAAAAI